MRGEVRWGWVAETWVLGPGTWDSGHVPAREVRRGGYYLIVNCLPETRNKKLQPKA